MAAQGQAASELQVPEGTPLLSVERLSLSWDDRPMEWRRGLYVTLDHHYRNLLN